MKEEKNVEMEEKSVFEKLFDPEDASNIVLYDENEKPVEFEQIAIIPIKEEVYAVLRPVEKMEGLDEDQAIVFLLDETNEGEEILNVVDDDETIDLVFDEYEKIFNEQK